MNASMLDFSQQDIDFGIPDNLFDRRFFHTRLKTLIYTI